MFSSFDQHIAGVNNANNTVNNWLISAPKLSIGTTQLSGTLLNTQFPILIGDITTTGGTLTTTLATVNSNIGTYTNCTLTVNGKGLITAVSNGKFTDFMSYTCAGGF